MSILLKYDYRKFSAKPSKAFPRRFSVSRPVIPIQLISGERKIKYLAIIDSGADVCIFHAEIGEVLGIAVESGRVLSYKGVEGKELTAHFHNIQIAVGGYEFNCYAGFSRDLSNMPYGILGQNGFFNLFNVIFDYDKERIELKTRE